MLLPVYDKKKDTEIIKLLEEHCNQEKKLLKLFDNEEINIEDLSSKINDLKKLRSRTLKYLSGNKTTEDKILQYDKNSQNYNKKIKTFVKDKEIDTTLLQTYEKVKEEISSIYTYLSREKEVTPVLNLDLIKNFILQFSYYLLKKEEEIENVDINGLTIALSNIEEKISIILKNNKKIIITDKNYNFEEYTKEELIEILRFFDVLSYDSSYDHIRNEIVKQINTL